MELVEVDTFGAEDKRAVPSTYKRRGQDAQDQDVEMMDETDEEVVFRGVPALCCSWRWQISSQHLIHNRAKLVNR